MGPNGGFDDGVPAVANVAIDLLVGRFVEVGDVTVDEILPVLGDFFGGHGGGHVDDVFEETVAGVDAGHVGSSEEDGLVTERLAGLRDGHGIESGAESGLREEGDGFGLAHAGADVLRELCYKKVHLERGESKSAKAISTGMKATPARSAARNGHGTADVGKGSAKMDA